jgi:NADH pyrophosphatase NudC (nudix superfamily)
MIGHDARAAAAGSMPLFQVCSNSSDLAANNRRLQFCPHCGTRFAAQVLEKFSRQRCAHCGFIHYLNPTPGITIIVRSPENTVLIGRRAATARYGGKWCLPGGYIEYEESFIDTAHREVREETGLDIEIDGIVNVVSNHLDDRHHTLVIVLLGRVASGHAAPGDDLTELQWIDSDRHRTIPYAFEADRRIIDCYFYGNIKLLPIDNRIKKR